LRPKINREEWEALNTQSRPEQIAGCIWGFFGIGGVWFVAVASWGLALGSGMRPFLITAIIVGSLFGLIAANAIGRKTSRTRSQMQSAGASTMTVGLTVPVIVLAAIVWLIRQIIQII